MEKVLHTFAAAKHFFHQSVTLLFAYFTAFFAASVNAAPTPSAVTVKVISRAHAAVSLQSNVIADLMIS